MNSHSVVTTLMKHRLVRSRGRKQVVGRPLLYGTTKDFLERFELDRLEDLPKLREFEETLAAAAPVPVESGSGGPDAGADRAEASE